MTIQDVIRAGEQIDVPRYYNSGPSIIESFLLLGAVVIALLIVLLIGMFIQSKTGSTNISNAYLMGMLLLACIAIIYQSAANTQDRADYENEIAEWKQEVVFPYLSEQAYADRELVSIEEVPGQTDEPTYVVKYQDEDQIVQTFEFDMDDPRLHQILYDVPADETPFVRLYTLEKDIGHGITAGDYGLSIHLNDLKN